MNQQKSDKVFVNGLTVEEKQWPNGGTSMKLGFSVGKMIEFLNQHKNERGFVNVRLSRSKRSGEWYAELDTWQAKPRGDQQRSSAPKEREPNTGYSTSGKIEDPDDKSSVPF